MNFHKVQPKKTVLLIENSPTLESHAWIQTIGHVFISGAFKLYEDELKKK